MKRGSNKFLYPYKGKNLAPYIQLSTWDSALVFVLCTIGYLYEEFELVLQGSIQYTPFARTDVKVAVRASDGMRHHGPDESRRFRYLSRHKRNSVILTCIIGYPVVS